MRVNLLLAGKFNSALNEKKVVQNENKAKSRVFLARLFAFLDDVEKMSERPACKYFRRAAKPLKGEQVASFERRREHGAPKDKKWHNKKYLYEIRADFARIQNEVLARNGFPFALTIGRLKLNRQKRKNTVMTLPLIFTREYPNPTLA